MRLHLGTIVAGLACVGVLAVQGSAAAESTAGPAKPLQHPPGRTLSSSGLNAVSAVSTSDAWAVGDFWPDRGAYASRTLTKHWDGARWTRVPSPSPGVLDALYAVSALDDDDVWAVGSYDELAIPPSPHGLIEHWDGHTWATIAFPDPGVKTGLQAVTAVSANDVWVAGGYTDAQQNSHDLLEHWDGTTWTIVPTTDPISVGQSLSADAAGGVWGVAGQSIGHQGGHGWVSVKDPNLEPHDGLSSVSAASATDVWVAGIRDGGRPLLEHWDGLTWTSMPSTLDSFSYLEGVQAVSASDAWAVGGVHENRTLIEHWDGTAWTRAPRGGTPRHGWLVDVTATSTSDVWAVGSSGPHPVIVHFDGTSWSRM